jgi:PA14 domain
MLAAGAALIAMFVSPIIGTLFLQPKLNQAYGLLGRYYEGLEPGRFPPHITRVDSNIDFDGIVALGALPSPSTVRWSGRLYVPTTGLYQFVISADDDGWLVIDGNPVIRDPGEVTLRQDEGGIMLTAGWHDIQVNQRNLWGDASIHLFWQTPGAAQSLIPDHYLIPANAD